MDPADGSVWAASNEDAQNAALFHFSPTGQFIHKYMPAETKSDHLFNDLVVCRDGDVFLTDSTANQVYKLPQGQATLVPVTTPRRLYYPNGIALSANDKRIFIADAFSAILCWKDGSVKKRISGFHGVTISLVTQKVRTVSCPSMNSSDVFISVLFPGKPLPCISLTVRERTKQRFFRATMHLMNLALMSKEAT